MQAEQLTPAVAHHGEAPAWIRGTSWPEGLYWADQLAGDVLFLSPTGAVERRHVGAVVAAVRPRRDGGLAYAIERGFAVDDGPGSAIEPLPELWEDPDIRMNEGGCDPAGAFYCGSMAYDAGSHRGAFYRLGPDRSVQVVERGWTIPNGLEWSSDGTTAYHVDTVAQRVDRWSWDEVRGLHDRRPFLRVDGPGSPDGLTVDVEGGIWVAMWGGGCVRRYTAEGTLSEVVTVPAAQVSSCTFGGAGHDELFITTSREAMSEPEPCAGAVFAVHPGVAGVALRPYAG